MAYEPDSWTQSELMLNVAYVTFPICQGKDIENQIVCVAAVIKGFQQPAISACKHTNTQDKGSENQRNTHAHENPFILP